MANGDLIAFNVASFVCALFVLEFGADKFIDHTAIVARRTGISQALIGLLTAGAEWEEVRELIIYLDLSRQVTSKARGRSNFCCPQSFVPCNRKYCRLHNIQHPWCFLSRTSIPLDEPENRVRQELKDILLAFTFLNSFHHSALFSRHATVLEGFRRHLACPLRSLHNICGVGH